MKLLAWMLVLALSSLALAQSEHSQAIVSASENVLLKLAAEHFAQGKYNATVEELNSVESKLKEKGEDKKEILGLISYWRGIANNRLQNFPDAIADFDKALTLDYSPLDINYEYGQALFAAEKLKEARIQFRESLKKKFKRGVSLYYIAYISKDLGERKKAVTFYKAINKLPLSESKDVIQPAQMQIGDIYLEQAEKHLDAFRVVELYVIPQYEKALAVNPEGHLADEIRKKITDLQRRYDLILFNLLNGRPTLRPPYFLRAAQEIGRDTNVTFSPAETTVSKARQGSMFSKTEAMGRYTFYYKNYFSYAPEFRFTNTYYFNRVPEIYRNDNYTISPSLRTSYEHSLWKKPASVLFDYEYNEAQRDVNARKELEFSSRSHGFMLGERFTYIKDTETIVRVRRRMTESYLSSQDSETTSFALEHMMPVKLNTLLLFLNYDRTRVEDESYDTNALTFRGDIIMSQMYTVTPTFGVSLTWTDPINNRSARGKEFLFNPNARLSRQFGKNWRGNLKYDYQNNSSKDKANFAFKKNIMSFELEYIF